MLQSILAERHAYILQQALGASALRQKIISNNIANVNTPRFKKSEVAFEDILRNALDGDSDGKLSLTRTDERHLPMTQGLSGIEPAVHTINTTSTRNDGNNVDIDTEMAGMAENTIYYDALAQQLGKYYTSLKSVISGGK